MTKEDRELVERLRGLTKVTQFDSAGLLESYDATPTDVDRKAADAIERLSKDNERLAGALVKAVGLLEQLMADKLEAIDLKKEASQLRTALQLHKGE